MPRLPKQKPLWAVCEPSTNLKPPLFCTDKVHFFFSGLILLDEALGYEFLSLWGESQHRIRLHADAAGREYPHPFRTKSSL